MEAKIDEILEKDEQTRSALEKIKLTEYPTNLADLEKDEKFWMKQFEKATGNFKFN